MRISSASSGVAWLVLAATAATAQSPFTSRDGSDDGDSILPITSYPLGQSQLVSRNMARALRIQWIERDLCDRIGCLIVHNDTRLYKLAEMRVELIGRDGTSRWGRNQLERPLYPKERLTQFKVAPPESCDRAIQFVLKHRKTRERLVMEAIANLCSSPNVDNVIRLDVVKPEVTVGADPAQ
jgi:hypothetical protein